MSDSGDPADCSLPGSSVHGILQARILEWVAIPGDLPYPRIEPRSPALEADALTSEPPGKSLIQDSFLKCLKNSLENPVEAEVPANTVRKGFN